MSIYHDNQYEDEARRKIAKAQIDAMNNLAKEQMGINLKAAEEFHAMRRAQMPDVIDVEFREVSDAPLQVSIDKEQ